MEYSIDNLDRRILYRLQQNARKTTAPEIADEMDVSPSTVRKRIDKLEENGVIEGYHAKVDYAKCDGMLTNILTCKTPLSNRHRLSKRLLDVPGVINVQELMTGNENIRVKIVGEDTDSLTRIARKLTNLGLEVKDESLLYREYFNPYHGFRPDSERELPSDIQRGDGMISLKVTSEAPIAGKTLQKANKGGIIPENVLVVSIERNNRLITPKGTTTIHDGDTVKLFSSSEMSPEDIEVFNPRMV